MRSKYPVLDVAGLSGLFTVVNLAFAQTWTPTGAPTQAWTLLLQQSAHKTPLEACQTGALLRTPAPREWPLEMIACRSSEFETTVFCYN